MRGFGIHSSIWTMDWTPQAAEHAVAQAKHYEFEFIEVALLNPTKVDTSHSRDLFTKAGISAVCSSGCLKGHGPRAIRTQASRS